MVFRQLFGQYCEQPYEPLSQLISDQLSEQASELRSEQPEQDSRTASSSINGDRADGSPRPTGTVNIHFPLGIALGGGAARGLSHIGVLKVLSEHGVSFPIVTGTSMGAIVGAAYVCGKLAEIEAVARTVTPLAMSEWFDMNLHTGALKGDAVKEVFRQFVGDTTFEDLRDRGISFAVVAADLDKEEPVYISEGRIDDAVRASMSIPGVFEPVCWGGRVLVDGGLMDNVPVDAARSLGARLVIGVEVLNNYDIWHRAALRLGFSFVHLREMRARLRQMAFDQRYSLRDVERVERAPRDFTIPVLNRFKWSLSTPAEERSFTEGSARLNQMPADIRIEEGAGQGEMPPEIRSENRSSLKTTLDALDIIASVLEDGRMPFRANSRADVFIRPDVARFHAHQFYRASQLIALGERAAREALPDIMALLEGQLTGRQR